MNKQVKDLTLSDRLIIFGMSVQILALQRHGKNDQHVTVTVWGGPASLARDKVYTLDEVVEVEGEK